MKLNWEADSISEIFGYSELQDLKDAPEEVQTQAILTIMLTHNMSNKEKYILATLLIVITGIEIDNSIDLCKYFVSLEAKDRKKLVVFWQPILDNEIDYSEGE